MKRLTVFFIIGLIISSCSVNNKEIIILKTLDQFERQEENERLGVDILNYMFPVFLQQEFPDFTQNDLKNITWQYFIRESDKQVSFRLILSNEVLSQKDKITDFFEKTVDEQVERQVQDREIFDKAVKLTEQSLEQLDNGEFDEFWSNSGSLMQNMTTKEDFFATITDRKKINTIGGDRVYHSKQYYNKMPNSEKKDFYVVNLTFEKDKNMMEQITFQLEDGELKIAGYTNRLPN
ncbi:DUF4019 domain-containing protein [Marinifilum sp. RC60d5]|uniref:DUF4019 domain-containing protein n=1 Tax=Marinifilum sp. RC60d5 TaxID=3458414 RepID=UPI00403590B6